MLPKARHFLHEFDMEPFSDGPPHIVWGGIFLDFFHESAAKFELG